MLLRCSQSLPGFPRNPYWFSNPFTKIPLLHGTSSALYADDVVVYRTISGPVDIEALQSDIDKTVERVGRTGLPLNTNKLNVIVFSRKLSRPSVTIMVNNSVLPSVDPVCYLGVTVN